MVLIGPRSTGSVKISEISKISEDQQDQWVWIIRGRLIGRGVEGKIRGWRF